MNTAVFRKEWVGQLVDGRFRLLQWLGSSGHSDVFLCAIDEDETRKAAIKLFPADIQGSAACEAGWAVAASLDHPHLLRVLHTGRAHIEDSFVLYVVTEYAGEVLSEILPDRALTSDEVKEMLGPVLDALAYLHDKGLVHGRVKPSNILVVDDQLKLSVENIRGSAAHAAPPEVLEIYDPPERAAGRVMPASDLWSLGATLVEALTRIPPAWNRSSGADPIVPPSVPSPFRHITGECLRVDPALRCALGEIRTCLESGTPVPHRTKEPGASGTKIVPRKNRHAVALAAAAAVLVIGFAIVMLSSHHSEPAAVQQSDQQSSDNDEPGAESTALPAAPTQPAKAVAPQHETPAQQAQAAVKLPEAPVPQAQAPAAQNAVSAPEKQAPRSTQTAAPVSTPHEPAGKGAVAERVLPDVPESASRTISGTVKVGIQVMVDASGAVTDAAIASQGPSKYFANLALQAAQAWKFAPPQVNGQGVPSVWLVQFAFRQTGIEATPTQQTP
jgi:TonB family protein